MKKENMGTHMPDNAAEHEPLLFHVPAPGPQSHSYKGISPKVVVCSIVVLFLIFVTFLAFCGGRSGQNECPDFEKDSTYFSSLGNLLWTGHGSLHLKIKERPLIRTNVQQFVDYLVDFVSSYSSMVGFGKQHQMVDDIVIAEKVATPGPDTQASASNSAVLNTLSRRVGRRSIPPRAKVFSFLKIVQDLTREGLLQHHHKVLCLDSSVKQKVLALKKRGFSNVEGVDISPTLSISKKDKRNTLQETLADQSFDFAFTAVFDDTSEPALFVAEIERTLKVGGFAAMHVSLSVWRDKFITSKPGNGVKPVTLLFKTSNIVYVSTAYAPGLDTVIVFKKLSHVEKTLGAGQAEMDRKQPTFLSLEGRSSRLPECRKCTKEQLATDGYGCLLLVK